MQLLDSWDHFCGWASSSHGPEPCAPNPLFGLPPVPGGGGGVAPRSCLSVAFGNSRPTLHSQACFPQGYTSELVGRLPGLQKPRLSFLHITILSRLKPCRTISSAPLITPQRMLMYFSSFASSGSSTKSVNGVSCSICVRARLEGRSGGAGGQRVSSATLIPPDAAHACKMRHADTFLCHRRGTICQMPCARP